VVAKIYRPFFYLFAKSRFARGHRRAPAAGAGRRVSLPHIGPGPSPVRPEGSVTDIIITPLIFGERAVLVRKPILILI